MTFNQFIWRNTMRNRQLYLAYFMSILFSVMVFFTFSVFADHPYLLENIGNSVTTGLRGAQVIIYGFAFFFVLYSMTVFLQSRKREFGTLLIQGMSPKQLRQMVFLENFLIGLLATVVGIIGGIGFATLVLALSEALLGFPIPWYWPTSSMLLTFIAFLVLFGLISLLIQFRLPKLSVQELLKSSENGQGELRTSWIKTLLAVVFILVGYGLATIAKGVTVVLVFFPVLFLVVVGTYFLFNQFCVRLAKGLTHKKQLFWKRTNLLVFSDLAFRMKENARAFFLVSIISTVAFASIGTLLGFRTLSRESLDSQLAEVTYTVTEDSALTQRVQQSIDETLATQAGVTYQREPLETKLVAQSDNQNVSVVKATDFNRLLRAAGQATIEVGADEVVQMQLGLADGMLMHSEFVNPANGRVQAVRQVRAKNSPLYGGILIAGDELYTQLVANKTTMTLLWFVQGGNEQVLGKALNTTIEQLQIEGGQLYSKSATATMLMGVINPTLFVGLFIGIVFFISAGSFLYFRLYSDFDADVQKFGMVRKIGLTNRELQRMISQQIGILFFVPIGVSLVHGFVALSAMFRIFEQPISLGSIVLLAVFALIQLIFYLLARHVYLRKVVAAIIK